ncbi:MAG: hypothetical protein HY982_00495 [Candidatus Magasanikbacteria bacterium]|nr:hypothetical protein [Candidatus Magasanikbacteria bacterium]
MNLRPLIFETLAFFSLFNHPLTLLELRERLFSSLPVDLESLSTFLEEELKKGTIKEANGFFFLNKDGCDGKMRSQREMWQALKMRQAVKAGRFLSWTPFVKLAAVCNTLGLSAAQEDSDIDFFLVARTGRIWTARFLSVLILFLSGLYRRPGRVKDRICPSFFVSEKSLNLESIALKRGEDIYLTYWIIQLIPLIDRGNILRKFWQANSWVGRQLANFRFENKDNDLRKIKEGFWARSLRKFLEKILGGFWGDNLEKFLRFVQLLKMGKPAAGRFGDEIGVVVSEEMLKFHEEDRRAEYQRRWLEVLKAFDV